MKRRKLDSEYIHGLGKWTSDFSSSEILWKKTPNKIQGIFKPVSSRYLWKSLVQAICCFHSDDLDELEVYGADTKGTELASYAFEVQYTLGRTLYTDLKTRTG